MKKKTMKDIRGNKNTRLILIVLLVAVAAGVWYFSDSKAAKNVALVAGGVAITAGALEIADTDLDLGTLLETGSIKEALLERDEDGNIANVQAICDATDYNYNCSDFETQKDANYVADQCDFDVFGLDGDKDGIVCEALPLGN